MKIKNGNPLEVALMLAFVFCALLLFKWWVYP
jgi:hypothetical protein